MRKKLSIFTVVTIVFAGNAMNRELPQNNGNWFSHGRTMTLVQESKPSTKIWPVFCGLTGAGCILGGFKWNSPDISVLGLGVVLYGILQGTNPRNN